MKTPLALPGGFAHSRCWLELKRLQPHVQGPSSIEPSKPH
jgi:hypothetical protein